MIQNQTSEAIDAQEISSSKKPWIAPKAVSEEVRTVTQGPTGTGGDSMNSCHS